MSQESLVYQDPPHIQPQRSQQQPVRTRGGGHSRARSGSCKRLVTLCVLTILSATFGCSSVGNLLNPAKNAEPGSLTNLFSGRMETGDADPRGLSPADSKLKGPLAMARLNERRGRTDEAEMIYRKVMEREPDHPLPYHRLGIMLAKAGRVEEAEPYFQRALELMPGDPELLADVGYYYYVRDLPQQAEHHLRQALQIAPNDAKTCNNLAVLLGEQERDDECLDLFRRGSEEAEALANMAFVYSQRGELDRAVETYSRALTLDPELRVAAEALVELAKYAPPQEMPKYRSLPNQPETTAETRLVQYEEGCRVDGQNMENVANAFRQTTLNRVDTGAESIVQPTVWNAPLPGRSSSSVYTPAPVILPGSWQPPLTSPAMMPAAASYSPASAGY